MGLFLASVVVVAVGPLSVYFGRLWLALGLAVVVMILRPSGLLWLPLVFLVDRGRMCSGCGCGCVPGLL
jgi:hypothetical protein